MGYGLGRENRENPAGTRTVVLASADAHFRERLRRQLTAMRWQVREAAGGAEAIAELEKQSAEAMVLDSALPDLEVGEFARQMRHRHPVMELLCVDAGADTTGPRSPRRNELLHALRQAQQEARGGGASDAAAWALAPVAVPQGASDGRPAPADERALVSREITALLRSRDAAMRGVETQGSAQVAGEENVTRWDKSAADTSTSIAAPASARRSESVV